MTVDHNEPAKDLARDLATEVLVVLELQRKYFRSRDTMDLAKSKEAERALKAWCELILSDKKHTPSLFENIGG